MQKKILPIITFAKISIRRSFRDKTAIFFIFLFPLIFLFVFGGIFGKSNSVSFRVALVNQSETQFAKSFVDQAGQQKVLKIDKESTTYDAAKAKMSRGQLDAIIVLPKEFGQVQKGQDHPSGQAQVVYSQNSEQAGQTLVSILKEEFKGINSQFVSVKEPFVVVGEKNNDKTLSSFDYVFSGLLGFSIIGLGIFGPTSFFPELKKQGVLRRIHTTPLKVWQYFTASVISQAVVGVLSIALMFVVAIAFYDLKLVGNIFALVLFMMFSIASIFGIGLAIGGWAKNERQAAPLTNIVTFPMMFLSGTFFPRFLMPEWLQTLSGYLPLTPVIDGIRLIATEGKTLLEIGPQIGLIAAWTLIIYVIAFRVFRWE